MNYRFQKSFCHLLLVITKLKTKIKRGNFVIPNKHDMDLSWNINKTNIKKIS